MRISAAFPVYNEGGLSAQDQPLARTLISPHQHSFLPAVPGCSGVIFDTAWLPCFLGANASQVLINSQPPNTLAYQSLRQPRIHVSRLHCDPEIAAQIDNTPRIIAYSKTLFLSTHHLLSNMSTTPTTTTGITVSSGHSHHRGKRLRHFILPDGRKVHIALSPEEAESLRQRLTAINKDEPFDLVISGSPEHLEALRHAHSHYDEKREMLRAKHGPDYDEFENVRTELDTLSSELHMLTDHAVALDANFSKYGYSAHLRTYDDHSAPGSSASSISGFHDPDHEKKDWESEKRNGRIMKIYKKVYCAADRVLLLGLGKALTLSSPLSDNTSIKGYYGEPRRLQKWHLLSFSSTFSTSVFSPSTEIMPPRVPQAMSSSGSPSPLS